MRRIILIALLATGFATRAQHKAGVHSRDLAEKKGDSDSFNVVETIMEHIADAHEWRLWGQGDGALDIPLPVILVDGGLKVFSSARFNHGRGPVEEDGRYYARYHGRIYRTDVTGHIDLDAEGNPNNPEPLDLSITKNVAAMLVALVVLLITFSAVARAYSKDKAPKGL